jgi:hypothetical protein
MPSIAFTKSKTINAIKPLSPLSFSKNYLQLYLILVILI